MIFNQFWFGFSTNFSDQIEFGSSNSGFLDPERRRKVGMPPGIYYFIHPTPDGINFGTYTKIVVGRNQDSKSKPTQRHVLDRIHSVKKFEQYYGVIGSALLPFFTLILIIVV